MSEESQERIVHTFSSQERYVLINLVEQILELLGQSSVSRDPLHDIVGISGNELPPDDPVLKRLLPSAYHELQDAAEFRRYTEDSLRNRKRAHAHRIREMLLAEGSADAMGGDVSDEKEEDVFVHGENEVEMSSIRLTITGEDCWAWLGGLNDVRLALAVRLDIGGTSMGDLPNDQHRFDGNSMPGGGVSVDSVASNASSEGSAADREDTRNRRFEVMKESDPMKAVFAVYSWLGWLQEELLHQLDSDQHDSDQHGEDPSEDQPLPTP